MTNCKEAFKLIVDFTLSPQGEKSNEIWKQIKEHSNNCDSCRQTFSSIIGSKFSPLDTNGSETHSYLTNNLKNLNQQYTDMVIQKNSHEEKEIKRQDSRDNPISKRFHLLLLLLWSKGFTHRSAESIQGLTRLMKLLFLIKMEGLSPYFVSDYYTFEPYKFGPFEKDVCQDIELLIDRGIIAETFVDNVELSNNYNVNIEEIKNNCSYALTEQGSKLVTKLAERTKACAPEILNELEAFKQKYGVLSLHDLLKYVYTKYPEYATKSEILKDVMDDKR